MKMQRKQIPFEEVYDLFAIRIVFKPLPFPSEKTQCYQIYATITDIYTPKPDRLPRLDQHPESQRLRGAALDGDEPRRRMGRGADPHAAHGRHRRKGSGRPLEVQQETISQNEDELDKWLKKIRDALNSPTGKRRRLSG